MAIVKANAYGHGLIPAAKATIKGGASALGVALLQEGVALRSAGVTAPVVVLAPTMPEQADSIVAHNLSQTIGHPAAIPPLEAAATDPFPEVRNAPMNNMAGTFVEGLPEHLQAYPQPDSNV